MTLPHPFSVHIKGNMTKQNKTQRWSDGKKYLKEFKTNTSKATDGRDRLVQPHLAHCLGPPVWQCVSGPRGRVATSHLIGVGELELPAVARPADEGLAGLVRQELQEKLPQLDGAAACGVQEGDGGVLALGKG